MSSSRLASGVRVGPYEVLALLGRGGMGEVYRARDPRLSRDVALKVLHGEFASESARLRRFEQEARAAGALNHPNIVGVYDTGKSGGSQYIVSELLEGETLRERLATGGLGLHKSVEYAAQIARGLAAAHDRGIVHRDLKPENLFVTKDRLVKILDFGIAKLSRPDEEALGKDVQTLSATSPGTVLGTAGYMSPEQARGLATDSRTDVFALGAVLFEMLTGRRAFKGTTPADTLSAILREDPTERIAGEPEIPSGLLRIVRRCLEKSPEDRFQSARDLAFALESVAGESVVAAAGPGPHVRRGLIWRVVLGLVAAGVVCAFGLWLGRRLSLAQEVPSFQRLTFRVGVVRSARFAANRETILLSASWGDEPSEVFSTRTTSQGLLPRGIKDARLLSVSSKDEMALLLHPQQVTAVLHRGTLAVAPVAGGTPREVLENVLDADWSPDGRELALVWVTVDGNTQIQFPKGHLLYAPQPPHWISMLRVSPRGDRIAFFEHPTEGDMRGDLRLVDLQGRVTTLAADYANEDGLAWSAGGSDVQVSAKRSGTLGQLIRVSLDGRERVALGVPGTIELLDVSRAGDLLVGRGTRWMETRARGRGAREESELAAGDLSSLSDLSDDGTRVLGTDIGEGSGPNSAYYVQATDGSAPVWLGEGDASALSPDGRFALVRLVHTSPEQLQIVPTGPGDTRVLAPGPVVQYRRAVWDPSGRRIVFSGIEREGGVRLYVQDVSGGPPRAMTPAGVSLFEMGRPVSPDGTRVVALGPEDVVALHPLAGGEPVAVPGLTGTDVPLCFTPDGRELFVAHYAETPPRVERVEIASGRARPWTGVVRSRPSGLQGQYRLLVTPDGASYAYSYNRKMSDLYLVTGQK